MAAKWTKNNNPHTRKPRKPRKPLTAYQREQFERAYQLMRPGEDSRNAAIMQAAQITINP